MKVLVTGGRDVFDAMKVYTVLDTEISAGDEIVELGSSGTETLARYWAQHNGVKFTTVKAAFGGNFLDNIKDRDKRLFAEHQSFDFALVFEGSKTSDTSFMVKQLQERGITICQVGENGTSWSTSDEKAGQRDDQKSAVSSMDDMW